MFFDLHLKETLNSFVEVNFASINECYLTYCYILIVCPGIYPVDGRPHSSSSWAPVLLVPEEQGDPVTRVAVADVTGEERRVPVLVGDILDLFYHVINVMSPVISGIHITEMNNNTNLVGQLGPRDHAKGNAHGQPQQCLHHHHDE